MRLTWIFLPPQCREKVCCCPEMKTKLLLLWCWFVRAMFVEVGVCVHSLSTYLFRSARKGIRCPQVHSFRYTHVSSPSLPWKTADLHCFRFHLSFLAIDFLRTWGFNLSEEEQCTVLILQRQSLRHPWVADLVAPCSLHWENEDPQEPLSFFQYCKWPLVKKRTVLFWYQNF